MVAHSNAPSWVKWDRVAPVKTALQGLLLHRWRLHEYSLFIVIKNYFPKPTQRRFTSGRTRKRFNAQKFSCLIFLCWSSSCLVLSPGSVHVSRPSGTFVKRHLCDLLKTLYTKNSGRRKEPKENIRLHSTKITFPGHDRRRCHGYFSLHYQA